MRKPVLVMRRVTERPKAVEAGCTVEMPPTEMFWGDRYSKVADPFGYSWGIATHIKDLTPEEMAEGQKAFFAQMAEGGGACAGQEEGAAANA